MALLASLPPTSPAGAEDQADSAPARTTTIGPQYGAGFLRRWLWGAGYRRLYTSPITLPVLDLATDAGGLTPTVRVGHGETPASRLQGPRRPRLHVPARAEEQQGADAGRPARDAHAPAAHRPVERRQSCGA